MRFKCKKYVVYCILMLILSSCVSMLDNVLESPGKSQLQKRNYQSRRFDTDDKLKVMKAILSTMQDLGFIVEKASDALGTISGTDFIYLTKLTVSVRIVGKQAIVRANASRGHNEITDPIVYQNFFNALSQSLFLEGHDDL